MGGERQGVYSVNCLLPHTGEEVTICCNVAAITVLAAGSCRPANEEKFSEATNRPFAASEVSSLDPHFLSLSQSQRLGGGGGGQNIKFAGVRFINR